MRSLLFVLLNIIILYDDTMTQVLGKIFRVFDVNGDGIISREEMNTIMKDMFELIKIQKPDCQSADSVSDTVFLEMDKNNVSLLDSKIFDTIILTRVFRMEKLLLKSLFLPVSDRKISVNCWQFRLLMFSFRKNHWFS